MLSLCVLHAPNKQLKVRWLVQIWYNGIIPTAPYEVNLDFLSISDDPAIDVYRFGTPIQEFQIDRLCTPHSARILDGNDLQNHLVGLGPKRAIRVGRCVQRSV
jgi:hypothetical protein